MIAKNKKLTQQIDNRSQIQRYCDSCETKSSRTSHTVTVVLYQCELLRILHIKELKMRKVKRKDYCRQNYQSTISELSVK